MFKKFCFAVFAFICLSFSFTHAQEIQATVTVNMDQLSFENRTNVSSLAQDLERYINNQKFTGTEWEGEKIPVDITIYLTGGSNNRYGARLLVISRRLLDPTNPDKGQSPTLKIFDQKWHFNYNLGASFTFNTYRFDEFASLIDYYMLLVIGFDMDTYGELDGSKAFDVAKSIVTLGASASAEGYETYSQPGDFTRFNLVNELIDMRFEPLRKLFFSYYVDGLEQMNANKEQATASIAGVIGEMAAFKRDKLSSASVLLQAFFDTKSQELALIFNGYEDKNVFRDLEYLDPGNTSLYEDAKDGKIK